MANEFENQPKTEHDKDETASPPRPLDPFESELNELLLKAQAGDSNAVEELIEASRDYLLLIANQELDADLKRKLAPSDIVQGAMLAIHQHFEQFRGDGREQFLGWIRQILLRGIIEARRKFKGADKRDIRRELAFQPKPNNGRYLAELPDVEPTPHTNAVQQEEFRIVAQAMARLSADHQQVIVWRNQDQLSFAEIGGRLQRSEAAAQKLWTRAIASLKQELIALGMIQSDE